MKALAAILSIFYLSVSSGVSLNVHFCHGELESVQVFSKVNCCCKVFMEDCCSDQSQYVQFENEAFQALNSSKPLALEVIDLPWPSYLNIQTSERATSSNWPPEATNLPPPTIPRYIANHQLVFYA